MKKMRLRYVAAAVVAGSMALSACGSSGASGGADDGSVKVGVIYPVSGSNAFVAEEMLNGLKLAVSDYNESKESDAPSVELLVEDDQSTANTGVSAFQKLVGRDKVSAIIGPFNSDVAAAVAPLAEREGVPEIATGATASSLIEADRKMFYRANSGNGLQAILTMKYVTETLGWNKVGFIYQETDWGKDLRDISIDELKRAGGEVAFDITYAPGTTNFMTTATKVAGSSFDGVVIAALGGEAPPLVRQLNQSGIPSEKLVGYSIDADQMLKNAGADVISGMYLSTPFDPWNEQFNNPMSKAFIEAYEAEYGSMPTLYAAQGSFAGQLITNAVSIAKSGDRKAIKKALDENRPIQTVYGELTLTKNRDVEPPLLMQQFQKDGKPKTIDVVEGE